MKPEHQSEIQDMFNKAVRGLRSQNFERCYVDGLGCQYSDGKGRHCAWGWVDPASHQSTFGSVDTLAITHVGLAGRYYDEGGLEDPRLVFAKRLQARHDDVENDNQGMEDALRRLGETYNLTWPED